MRRKFVISLVAVCVLMSTLAATVAQAETGPDITFEPPTYTLGDIHGQDGWMKTKAAFDVVVTSQSLYPSFGSQSLRISNGVTSGTFGDQTFSKPLENEAGETGAANDGMSGGERQPRFSAQFDFASVTQTHQPGLIFSISPDRGDGARMSWIELSDTADGLMVRFSDFQDGQFVYTTVASELDRTVPHTIELTMDFVDGEANDVVTITVDGTYTHTGTSWEQYFIEGENNPTRTVDSLLFRVAGTAVPSNQGYGFLIDNVQLASFGYTPSELIDNLQEDTANLVEHRKTERTLLASLNRAERYMEIRPQFARVALFQYILQVRLYEAFGLIDDDAADQLAAQAQVLIESLD